MGVDILAIIDHKLSAREAIDLPNMIQRAVAGIQEKFPGYISLKRTDVVASWDCSGEMTEEILKRLWRQYETDGEDRGTDGCDLRIKFAGGELMVFRKAIVVSHFSNHKYGNIFHTEASLEILNTNREIAGVLGSNEILYVPDSAYPTSLLYDKALEGWDMARIFQQGVNDNGLPPPDINRGRANYFFVDDPKQSLDSLQPFEELPEYWRYDETLEKYVQTVGL